MFRIPAALPVVAVLLSPSGQPKPVVEIPFHWPSTGQIALKVSVQGRPPATFLLDTGAEYSIIGTSTAASLGLETTRRGIRDFADGVTLAFNGIELRDQRVMVMPFDHYRKQGRDIEGIIGYDFFNRYVVDIDFERASLTVSDPGVFTPAPGGTPFPLEFAGRLPVVPLTIEFPGRAPLTARMMVDTGASQTAMLRHPFATTHRLFDLAPDAPTLTAGSLASGELRLVRLPAQRLRLGGWTFEEPFVRAFREPSGSGGYTQTDGLIGNELLRRFHVTFDYSRRTMTLRPNAHLREPFGR